MGARGALAGSVRSTGWFVREYSGAIWRGSVWTVGSWPPAQSGR